MRLIIITDELIFDGNSLILNKLFDEGLDTLHLRKPFATEQELETLLNQINGEYHDRIVLHDHFQLIHNYPLRGIHLNSRNSRPPQVKKATVSSSCHALENLDSAVQQHDYVFLSPIFDSISKAGYQHAFTREQLLEASSKQAINEKVIALGGISETTIPMAKCYGFGGVAVLGALWGNYIADRKDKTVIERFHRLNELCAKP